MARRKRKSKIGLDPLCALGTLAANKSFTSRDYHEYVHYYRDIPNPPSVKALVNRGVLLRVSRGKYYPTAKGWKVIDRACRRR